MGIESFGSMGVDRETRVQYEWPRRAPLERIDGRLATSELGPIFWTDMANSKPAVRFAAAAGDGTAARIEEQLVVTGKGCGVISRFPAEELVIAGARYQSVGREVPSIREVESHRSGSRMFGDPASSGEGVAVAPV